MYYSQLKLPFEVSCTLLSISYDQLSPLRLNTQPIRYNLILIDQNSLRDFLALRLVFSPQPAAYKPLSALDNPCIGFEQTP